MCSTEDAVLFNLLILVINSDRRMRNDLLYHDIDVKNTLSICGASQAELMVGMSLCSLLVLFILKTKTQMLPL